MVYNVLDLFSGCGGISLGFQMAGFNIVNGIDFNFDATQTFQRNFTNSTALNLDLSTLEEKQIPNIIKNLSDIDVIVGGPPCQGFSVSNAYLKDDDDPRNKLFFEFVKFVKLIQPKAIVIENVRGIATKNNGYAKDKITEIFTNLGYSVNFFVLNSAEFGIPQKRIRAFFLITKKKEKITIEDFKKQKNFTTVNEAISELYIFDNQTQTEQYILRNKPTNEYQTYLRSKDNTIHNHIITYPTNRVIERMKHVPQGGNWQDVPAHLFDKPRENRHSTAYKRINENEPCITIDTGHGSYFHPRFERYLTVREAARIQSFPDDFIFEGSKTSQMRQVGNAVPPLLAMQIAKIIKEAI